MFSRTEMEEKFLLDGLIECETSDILFVGNAFKRDAINDIAETLSARFGKPFSQEKVLRKCKSLQSRYKLWDTVWRSRGVKLNYLTNELEADAGTWELIIMEHPSANRLRIAPEMLWVELQLIFDHIGRGKDEVDMLPTMSPAVISAAQVICIDDDESEANVKDEQSDVARTKHQLPLSSRSAYAEKSHIGLSRARFDDDLESQCSRVSSVASSYPFGL